MRNEGEQAAKKGSMGGFAYPSNALFDMPQHGVGLFTTLQVLIDRDGFPTRTADHGRSGGIFGHGEGGETSNLIESGASDEIAGSDAVGTSQGIIDLIDHVPIVVKILSQSIIDGDVEEVLGRTDDSYLRILHEMGKHSTECVRIQDHVGVKNSNKVRRKRVGQIGPELKGMVEIAGLEISLVTLSRCVVDIGIGFSSQSSNRGGQFPRVAIVG